MRIRGFRYVLSSCVAAALLAGCGGSQPPIGAPGAMPQSAAIAAPADRSCGSPPESLDLEVLYPEPNARNVPPNLADVYVSTRMKIPSHDDFDFYFTQSNGARAFTSAFFSVEKSQVPVPHAKPRYPNPDYYASSLPPNWVIGLNQKVKLFWNRDGADCHPDFLVSEFKTKGK